jgi:UDP-2,3-diacylglucosamine pyrophosphatase LpxH
LIYKINHQLKLKEMSKYIFISDLHMNDERSLSASRPYGWLSENLAQNVANFLDYIYNRNDIDELVLLGDTLNTWVCPINVHPQNFDSILSAKQNQCIVEAFNKIILKKRTKVNYVIGNHDMLVTQDILSNYMPGINFIGDISHKGAFIDGRIRGEHGNQYAMFNAPDFKESLYKGLPLGYFISRIAATKGNFLPLSNIIKDNLKADKNTFIPELVIDVVLKECGLTEEDEIKLPDNSIVKISVVKEKYADMNENWVREKGPESALEALIAEIGIMDLPAFRLCINDINIVLFGHTHIEELSKNKIGGNYIYANTGTWCEENNDEKTQKPQSYVEIETDEITNQIYVRLYHWENNNPVLFKHESLM